MDFNGVIELYFFKNAAGNDSEWYTSQYDDGILVAIGRINLEDMWSSKTGQPVTLRAKQLITKPHEMSNYDFNETLYTYK